MITPELLDYILLSSIINTIVFVFTSYVLFFRYRLPIYHIMATYQMYHFAGFVYRPWVLYFSGTSQVWGYIGSNPTGPDLLWGTLLTTAAHLTMCAGAVATYPRSGGVPSIRPFAFSIGNPIGFALIVAVLLGLGIYGSFAQFGSALNLDRLAVVTTEIDSAGGARLVDVSGYQTILAEFLPITIITLFATPRSRKIAIILAGCFVFYRLLVGSGRSEFVILLFAFAIIMLINAGRRFPPLRFVVAGLVLLVIFDNLGLDRFALRKLMAGETNTADVFANYSERRGEAALSSDLQEYDVFSSVISIVPNITGYTFGTQYLRLFIWPVPRFFWPEKPVFTSIVNLGDYGHYFALTMTLYADSYMTLGGVGMIAILFAVSTYINWLYKVSAKRPTPFVLLVYVIHIVSSMILFRDGPVSYAYFILSLGIGSLLLCRLGDLKITSPEQ